MRIVVLPGDGIGPEITAATSAVLRAASERFQLGIALEEQAVGHASLEQFGTTVRPELLATVRAADGLILGPTATFDFKDEARGEINPSRYFRKNLDQFANVRPARTYSGRPTRFGTFDLVVVRENTEGFSADRRTVGEPWSWRFPQSRRAQMRWRRPRTARRPISPEMMSPIRSR